MSRLNWYEFRIDSNSEVTNSSENYRFEFDDATYNGVAARHTRETYTDRILGSKDLPDSITDVYTSKANNSIIGGHVKMYSSGQITMDDDMAGSQIIGMMNRGFAYTSTLDRDARLTSAGAEHNQPEREAVLLHHIQVHCRRDNPYGMVYTGGPGAPEGGLDAQRRIEAGVRDSDVKGLGLKALSHIFFKRARPE